MNWLKELNNSLEYIEENITTDFSCRDVADKAYSSYHHYLRMFHILSGVTLSEYIRYRRLTLAAMELITTKDRVIDIAYKYQYKTPESFSKAIKRFHGATPSEIRKNNVKIKAFNKLSFQLNIKGDLVMEYEIVKKGNLVFTGYEYNISSVNGENFIKIPQIWQEVMGSGKCDMLFKEANELGVVGICYDFDHEKEEFKYMIGINKEAVEGEGLKTVKFDDEVFAAFESKGALPKALQEVINQAYSEWFPSSNYEHTGGPEIEVYPMGDGSKDDYVCYYWVPIKEKK